MSFENEAMKLRGCTRIHSEVERLGLREADMMDAEVGSN